ncbi:MAG: alpha/beta fold hydrolase, partial [Acidobacteriaceae bacterium]|nr:alpha/beta fold hydrolase [Acidobacteriaceae bacterium]
MGRYRWGFAIGLLAVTVKTMAQNDPQSVFSKLPQAKEGDCVIENFKFLNGQVLRRLKIHYLTAGRLTRDANGNATNAVLVLHGTTGRALEFMTPSYSGELFGAGQPLDASKYFLIIPDDIGHGDSSKPSDGLRNSFPKYVYADMVAAQHQVVSKHLQIQHLELVTGISMGGMHSWIWAEEYPGMMDAVIPIASEPRRITGRNLLWRRILIEAVRRDPTYHDGNYSEQPQSYKSIWPMFHMMDDSPRHLEQLVPDTEQALAYIDDRLQVGHAPVDANDAIYAFDASRDYDPEPKLNDIRARVLAINFADDELNPVALGTLERLMPRVHRGSYVIIPGSKETHG